MDLIWLQLMGVCPYVMVSPQGGCRVGWVSATWCVVRLLLLITVQVSSHLLVPVISTEAQSKLNITAKLGTFTLKMGTNLAFISSTVLLLVLNSRLPRLLREMAALRKMMGTHNPSAASGHGPFTIIFLWASLVLYLFYIFDYLGEVTHSLLYGGWWLKPLIGLCDWVLNFPSFPGVVLLLSTVFVQLQAATRAALPHRWEQMLAEIRDEATQWYLPASSPACCFPVFPTVFLAPFLKHAQIMLLQTEEVLDCLLEYLGGAILVWLTGGIGFFTFSTYFLLIKLKDKGRLDYFNIVVTVVIILSLLAMNMTVEHLVKEVRLL